MKSEWCCKMVLICELIFGAPVLTEIWRNLVELSLFSFSESRKSPLPPRYLFKFWSFEEFLNSNHFFFFILYGLLNWRTTGLNCTCTVQVEEIGKSVGITTKIWRNERPSRVTIQGRVPRLSNLDHRRWKNLLSKKEQLKRSGLQQRIGHIS